MRFFLSAIIYFQVTISMAQISPEMRFRKISDEVLQGAEIRSFVSTREGLLWFGSNKGLASFDGSEMVYYGSKGLATNTNYRITDLCEDNRKNLWLITPELGLVFFNRKSASFKRIEISINKKIQSPQIQFVKVYIDRQGIVLIGTWNRGFFTYDPQTKVSHHYNLNSAKAADWENRDENSVRNILQDSKDNNIFWLACYGTGLYSFNKKNAQLKRNFKNSDAKDTSYASKCITGLLQLNDSIIWFHTWGYGMGEYNTNTGFYKCYMRNSGFRIDVYPNGHVIEFATKKSDSEYYIAPRDTIPAIFNINTKRYTFINEIELDKEIEKTYNVQTGTGNLLYYLKGGSLFVSSPRFNLFKNIELGPKLNYVYPEMNCIIWEQNTQKYYAGILLGKGVSEYDNNFNLIKKIPMPPYSGNGFANSTSIWKLHRDKANHLWALGHITCVYDSAILSFIPVKKKWPQLKLLDSAMFDVGEDKNGILYFISFKNELIELDPFSLSEKKILLAGNNKESGNFSTSDNRIFSDTLRNYIYFTANKNLYQYNILSKKFKKLFIESAYHINPMEKHNSSYALDAFGFIWISSPDHFLWKVNPDSFKISDTVKFTNSYIDINGATLYGAYNEYLLISTFKSQLLFNTKNYQCTYLDRSNGLLLNVAANEMVCNNHVFFSYAGVGKAQYAPIDALLQNSKNLTPYFSSILINNHEYFSDTLPQYLKKISLNYKQDNLAIIFSTIEAEFPNRLEYAYKLDNTEAVWSYTNNANRRINYANLSSGNYVFRVKVREWGLSWSPETTLSIIITPPFWKTWWFITISLLLAGTVIAWLVQWRINNIRKQVQLRTRYEMELLELEARALRSQMNPHFIFNCMNSIKSLIQQNNQDKAIMYLTTFSKLIRTIFQNSDKREISLFDEIETCKLYTQLESMRFGNKFAYQFNIDETIDLKSVQVPALIIQPFIENAIWHGIVPKANGGIVSVSVEQKGDTLCCTIEDNGIGREVSIQNKFKGEPTSHQSKGMQLTQARLDLDNALNKRSATVVTTDKKDAEGKSDGTKVVVTFKEY